MRYPVTVETTDSNSVCSAIIMNKTILACLIAGILYGCGGSPSSPTKVDATVITPPVVIPPVVEPPVVIPPVVVPPVVEPPVVIPPIVEPPVIIPPPIVVPPIVVPPPVVIPPVIIPPVQQSAEGVWGAYVTSTTGSRVVILDDGSTWGFFVTSGIVSGGYFSTSTVVDSTISGSGISIFNTVITPWTYVGSVTTGVSISYAVNATNVFSATYNPIYSVKPTSLAGTFLGYSLTGTTVYSVINFTVGATGAISSYDEPGCFSKGQLTPRANSGIYNLSITYTGLACKLGNQTTVKGIALYDYGINQIYASGVNSTKTDGFIFIGIPQ